MRFFGLKIFMFIVVFLDVVAIPSSCYNNTIVNCYFYYDEVSEYPDLDSSNLYAYLDIEQGEYITKEMIADPIREGYEFLGWTEVYSEIGIIEGDILVTSGHYYYGHKNDLIFYASWEEILPEDVPDTTEGN